MIDHFLDTDWDNDKSVVKFFKDYGPVWRLEKAARILHIREIKADAPYNNPIDYDGEWLTPTILQTRMVRIIRDIINVTSANHSQMDKNGELLDFYTHLLEEFQSGLDAKRNLLRLTLPCVPARYACSDHYLHIPTLDQLKSHKIKPGLILNGIAKGLINEGIKNIHSSLESYTQCNTSDIWFNTPRLLYKPNNLIELIYLQLAFQFQSKIGFRHYCSVCGCFFDANRRNQIWHNDACRKHVERVVEESHKTTSTNELMQMFLEKQHYLLNAMIEFE